jgi:hypothetical protein
MKNGIIRNIGGAELSDVELDQQDVECSPRIHDDLVHRA